MRVSSTGPGSTTLTVMPRAQFLGEVAGELRQCGLGGAQCDHAFPGLAAQAGTEIDDASPALFDHGGQDGFGDRERRWLHHAPARANHAGVPTMVIDAIHAEYIEIEYLGDHGYLVRIVYRSWALGLAQQLC